MEQFDYLEAAKEAASILKEGNGISDVFKATAFLRKVAEDFGGAPAFVGDLRQEADFYSEQVGLPVTDIEWMASILEAEPPRDR